MRFAARLIDLFLCFPCYGSHSAGKEAALSDYAVHCFQCCGNHYCDKGGNK